VAFDDLGLVLPHPDTGGTVARVLKTSGASLPTLPEHLTDGGPSGWVIETQQALVIPDTAAEERWPDAMKELRERGIASVCALPLATACRRVGALGFGNRTPFAYTPADTALVGAVARLVAVAIDNALEFDRALAMQRQLTSERDHLRLLLEVTNATLTR